METLADYLEAKVCVVFEQIDAETAHDIYALWLVAALHQDDPRYPELHSFGYSTNAYSTPDVVDDYGSRWSPGCIAAYVPLNLCQPEMPQWKQAGDAIGVALREQLFDAQNSCFNRSDEEDEALSRHAKLQANFNQGVITSEDAAELKSLTLRFDPDRKLTKDLRHNANLFLRQRDSSTRDVFIQVLGEVARRLHQKGVVERICGRAVPIGISFVNDVDERPLAAIVRAANPEGLSRGIEEEMLGKKYEQLEMCRLLDEEIAHLPIELQARHWVQALRESTENLYLGHESRLTERLRNCGLLRDEPALLKRLEVLTFYAVPLILSLIETRVSTAPDDPILDTLPYAERAKRHTQKDVASSLLLGLGHLAAYGDRDAIAEADVNRLHNVLFGLWNESEQLSAPVIGTELQMTARVLHSMRPKRFPVAKFGFNRTNGNRLLNYHEFGLHKAHEAA